jgi:primosomal protein N' (replication factor Y)
MYVDVILPLPLEGLFTYAVPEAWVEKVGFGIRVQVPLGKSKQYTAMVIEAHDRKPSFKCRDILEVLDDTPVLLPQQYRLWQWMADYYLSPLGEIFKAALPSGLKSEDGYKPRTEWYVGLSDNLKNEQTLHVALNMLVRAVRQQEAFTTYLALSHWDTIEGEVCRETPVEITREELMNSSHCTAAVIKNLVDRKFLVQYQREVGRLNDGGEPHLERIQPLSPAQQEAYNQVLFQFLRKRVVLLHGVTSSGKTEIYIHLIQQALEKKQQVLYLLPEIALTVQMMNRLKRVFGNRLGIYHSKYSDAERVEIWKKQLSANPYDVILGARSALFLPFQHLGLIIVDEEHETSFKQQDPAPRYHARNSAVMMGASLEGCKVLLGSATPSVESYYNAKTGKYGYVSLTTRYQDIQLPEIQVVDIGDLQHRKMMNGPFSPQLLAAVRRALERGEQAILFQNRRGFAPMIECKVCGWVPRCTNCDVSLTYHKNTDQLSCHYCGYTYQVPQACPCCGSTELRGRGYGTEKIEDQVQAVFPEARVARMDLDTTRTRNAYERLINDFSAGRTHILIGTQMVSKGLDFDKVSVVGILNADTMLNYPDFRAYEYAFMMLAQVSGRAGRKGRRGLVLLQTKSPQLPVIQQVVRNDYEGFFSDLMEERKAFHYPPFYRLVTVYLKHRHEKVVTAAGTAYAGMLRHWFSTRVLGPDKPSVAKVKTLHIRKIVLKLENGIDMNRVRQCLRMVQQQMAEDQRYGSVQVYYDVDPQ